MRRRTRATTVGTGALAVRNVALVVRRVEVLSVPAGWEDDGLADELALWIFWNGNRVGASAGCAAHKSAF